MAKRRRNTAGKKLREFLLNNLAGNIISFLLLFFCLLGINLLFSKNNYESFAFLTGVEVIILIPLLLAIYFWRKR
ncbi:MAG: hypothetical protein Q4P08_00815 [Eubacteriales bacterium]|nr:hypothetical protein [Eubacteriales bacterium]